ncbi:MAG TPA: hypothetical protein VHV53_00535 [Solirubrobacterales bacterium]|nr:hypothetical protein [Solirubrobacterales bacterium]
MARPPSRRPRDRRPGLTRGELQQELESRFRPLRPASTPRLILAAIFGPLLWVLCVLVAVFLVEPTDEILTGALVAAVSLVVAVFILLALRRARIREEREHVDSA